MHVPSIGQERRMIIVAAIPESTNMRRHCGDGL
jgi:hypothetical protein